VTFPLLSRHLGLRAAAGFAYNGGSNTAPGYRDEYLGYFAVGAGGELQVFFDESYRHRGTYAFGGAAVNSETFSRSGLGTTERRTRLGATLGLGPTLPAQNGKGGWTIELAYHATLTGVDAGAGGVAADYIRVGGGYVF
jgi:hypothetical protein